MSVWKDIRQKSLGKEDRIEEKNIYKEMFNNVSIVKSFTFFGVIDNKSLLPTQAEIGTIYIIKGTNEYEYVIYTNSGWETIVSMTEEADEVPTFREFPYQLQTNRYIVETKTHHYEAYFRKYQY